MENQAIGRALRLGQKGEVRVTRYVMKETIEQTLRNRQKMKLKVAELTWRRDVQTMEEHTLGTLMDLKVALF